MSGNYVLPHLNGNVYFDKPPFFFSLIAFSTKLRGEMTSFTVRFPSALFASLTILLTFILGKKLFNPRAGFFGALILATNIEFWWLAHRVNIDATLTFFTTLTIASFYFGFRYPKHQFFFLPYCLLIYEPGISYQASGSLYCPWINSGCVSCGYTTIFSP